MKFNYFLKYRAKVNLASYAAVVSFACSCLASTVSAENLVARMSGHWSPKHQSAIHSQIFADEVTKRSGGRLTIQFFPSGQLFGIREVMGAITSGAVELGGVVGVVSFPPINKNFNVASLIPVFFPLTTSNALFSKTTMLGVRFGMI